MEKSLISFTELDRYSVEKVEKLPVESHITPEEIRRIIATSSSHEFIVSYKAIEMISPNTMKIVMERIYGEDLYKFLINSKPSYPRLKFLIFQIMKAFSHLHNNNILHRDVSIANIMVVQKGSLLQPKLMDLNLLRPGSIKNVLLANPEYLDPFVNEYSDYDVRAELWSIGAMVYHILSWRCPFGSRLAGNSIQEIQATAKLSEPNLELVPVEFRKLIQQCLRKNKSERPESIKDCFAILKSSLSWYDRIAARLA